MTRSIRAAFTFLTRIPVGGYPYSAEELKWSSAHFPFVGLTLGIALSLIHGLAWPFGPWGAACVTVAASLLLTGAFHEDGLADTADAVGGGYTREQILSILKDSRIGTFGSAALSLSILSRIVALQALGTETTIPLIVIECLSRTPPVVVLATVPYVTRPDSQKSKDVTRGTLAQALVACAWAAVVLLFAICLGELSLLWSAVMVFVSGAIAYGLGQWFIRLAGGITGDFLGAIQQIVSLALWFIWIAR